MTTLASSLYSLSFLLSFLFYSKTTTRVCANPVSSSSLDDEPEQYEDKMTRSERCATVPESDLVVTPSQLSGSWEKLLVFATH